MQLSKKEMAETQMIVTTPEKWDVITRKGGEVRWARCHYAAWPVLLAWQGCQKAALPVARWQCDWHGRLVVVAST